MKKNITKNVIKNMSIYTKLFATAGLLSMTAAMLTSPVTNAQSAGAGVIEAPATSTGSFMYCSNPANGQSYAYNDVNAVIIKPSTDTGTAAFYITAKANVSGSVCNGFLRKLYVPYVAGHKTSFDIDSMLNLKNVKLVNSNPSTDNLSVSCDGKDTIVKVTDPNRDVLTVNNVVRNTNFDYTTSTNSDGELTIKFSPKKSDYVGQNEVDIYVNESITANLDYGYVAGNGKLVEPYSATAGDNSIAPKPFTQTWVAPIYNGKTATPSFVDMKTPILLASGAVNTLSPNPVAAQNQTPAYFYTYTGMSDMKIATADQVMIYTVNMLTGEIYLSLYWGFIGNPQTAVFNYNLGVLPLTQDNNGITLGKAKIDSELTTNKVVVTVGAPCVVPVVAKSSSSMMSSSSSSMMSSSSSSMMMSSSSMMMSSSSAKMMTPPVAPAPEMGLKGYLTRTGGSN